MPEIGVIIPFINNPDNVIKNIKFFIEKYDNFMFKLYIIWKHNSSHFIESYIDNSNNAVNIYRVSEDYSKLQCIREGVKWCNRDKLDYCIICDENILLNESLEKSSELLTYAFRYDIIGLDIKNNKFKCGRYDSKFNIEKIDTSDCKHCGKKIVIFHCDVINDFFLCRINTINKFINYNINDEKLYKYLKYNNYKIGFTRFCYGTN